MSETPVKTPTPAHITLLLKHARSTTVLSILPDTPIAALKSQVLQVLSARGIEHFPGTTTPLPTDYEDLELGVLIDKHEPQNGWVTTDGFASISTTKSSSKKKSRGVVETVGDLELKDGGWIAYRMHGPRLGDDDDEVMEDPGWNVEIPTFDDEEGHVEGGPFRGDDDGEEGYDDEDEDEEMDIPIPVPRNAIAK